MIASSTPTPTDVLTCVLMPPSQDEWNRLVRGDIDKHGIEGQLLSYFQVGTPS
jgi:hypothetical protein